MYREVIKYRKKELNVSAQWISEKADILDRTVKRMLSNDAPGETPDALFTNVSKVAGVLGLSLGDLDPNAAKDFEGKLVKDFLADYKKLSEDYSELKDENDRLRDENVILKEEMLAQTKEIVALQKDLIKMLKADKSESGTSKS